MRRALPLLVLLLAAASLHAAIELPREKEKWISTTVDDFTITSNAGERETIDVSRNLLRMREAVGRITKLKVRSAAPTSVIVFRNERSFAPYRDALMQTDGMSFTGLYLGGDDINVILLQADSSSGNRIVYHELAHSFLRNTAPGSPLWFSEGIAEYYSTFDARGLTVEIGRPITDHVRWLREKTLIPLTELFAMDTGSPAYNEEHRAGVFYAQSWALVHYLLAGNPERREQLPKLLSLLMSSRPAAEAVRGAFGIGLGELESELRRYVQGRAFTFTKYKLDELPTPAVPAPQAIPYDEILFRLGDVLARAGTGTRADGETHLREALKRNASHAGAHAALGRTYDAQGRAAEATRAFEEAVRLGTRDASVYVTYGASMFERREIARARTLFARAVELAPASARAWAGLGGTYVLAGDDNDAGVRALEKALALAPGQLEAAFGLVQLYALEERGEEAQKLIDTILVPAGNAGMLAHAREAMLGIEIERAMRLLGDRKFDEAVPILQAALAKTTDARRKTEIEGILTMVEFNRLTARQVDVMNELIALANAGKRAEAAAALDRLLPEIRNEQLLAWAKEVREQLPKTKSR